MLNYQRVRINPALQYHSDMISSAVSSIGVPEIINLKRRFYEINDTCAGKGNILAGLVCSGTGTWKIPKLATDKIACARFST